MEPFDRLLAEADNKLMETSFSARLAGITLPDSDGVPLLLGTLWASRPAVVVFLRHYG